MAMNYEKTMEHIEGWNSYRIVPGLSRIRALLAELGDPQDKLHIVHIAGTNGKGSQLMYLTSVLKAAGYRVGSYQSPTLEDYRERFMIRLRPIAKIRLIRLTEEVEAAAQRLITKGMEHPTAFEMETAMAYAWFAAEGADPVIIETGMGGLEDATNVEKDQICSILTPIGLDHCAFLGGTIPKITEHKAGILRASRPVFTAEQTPEAMAVIREKAKRLGSEIILPSEADKFSPERTGVRYNVVYRGSRLRGKSTLTGVFQAQNLALALQVLRYLDSHGYPIPPAKLREGLTEARLTGRFETVRKDPLTILDGAHNPPAATRLRETIDALYPDQPFIYVVGMLADKDVSRVLEIMAGRAAAFIALTPKNRRAMPAVELAGEAMKLYPNVSTADSVKEALEFATLLAGEAHLPILVFGSLSYLGAMKREVAHVQ